MRKWLLTAASLCLVAADEPILKDFTAYQSGIHGIAPKQTYYSSTITSPIFNYGTWRKGSMLSDPSYHLFMTLDYNGAGPYIFRDDDLSLVYANPSFDYAMNARVQHFDGKQWLTFWSGARNRGDSQGFCLFFDEHYTLKYNVTLGRPLTVNADMHECEVTPDGTVLLTAYQDKAYDLSSVGGRENDVLADSCFQEIDIEKGTVLFTWCASDHFWPDITYWNYTSTANVNLTQLSNDTAKVYTTSSGFDAYHINSLQKTVNGNYLVSLRNLHAIVYIDSGAGVDGGIGIPGDMIWVLGGKETRFRDITSEQTMRENGNRRGMDFAWQHHVRFVDNNTTTITLFDNHQLSTDVDCSGYSCSSGKELRVNHSDRNNLTVELVCSFQSPHGLQSVIFGSMQQLPPSDGLIPIESENYLISWGVNAEFTEHTNNGSLVRDVQYSTLYPGHSVGGRGVQSSRVYKQPWRGSPLWPPKAVANREGTVWVSWNGATEVYQWAVYGADARDVLGDVEGRPRADETSVDLMDPLKPLITVYRSGFETEIYLGHYWPPFVKVAALDTDGVILGYSDTVWMGSALSLRYKDTLSYIALDPIGSWIARLQITQAMLYYYCSDSPADREKALGTWEQSIELGWVMGSFRPIMNHAGDRLFRALLENAIEHGSEADNPHVMRLVKLVNHPHMARHTDGPYFSEEALARFYALVGMSEEAKDLLRTSVASTLDEWSVDRRDDQLDRRYLDLFRAIRPLDDEVSAIAAVQRNHYNHSFPKEHATGLFFCVGNCGTHWTDTSDLYYCRNCSSTMLFPGCYQLLQQDEIPPWKCRRDHGHVYVTTLDIAKRDELEPDRMLVGATVMETED